MNAVHILSDYYKLSDVLTPVSPDHQKVKETKGGFLEREDAE